MFESLSICLKCDDSIRGMCCHVNVPIGEFNIVLEHVHCPFLDLDTMVCSDYENRKQLAPWCLHGENMFGKGGLPKGCLHLKEHPEKEPHPKIKIREILPQLPLHKQQQLVATYNCFNNVPFQKYVEFGLET